MKHFLRIILCFCICHPATAQSQNENCDTCLYDQSSIYIVIKKSCLDSNYIITCNQLNTYFSTFETLTKLRGFSASRDTLLKEHSELHPLTMLKKFMII